jgi:hypothetical protein
MITKAIEDPSTITKGKRNSIPSTIYDGLSIGSTIKQNIVEKLPVINTQVKFHEKKTKNFCFS